MHSNTSRSGVLAATLASAMMLSMLSFCGCAASVKSGLTFSPDGRYLAYIKDDTLLIGLGPLLWGVRPLGLVLYSENLCWRSTSNPFEAHSICLSRDYYYPGKREDGPGRAPGVSIFRFSPDSRHFIFQTYDGRRLLVDVKTGVQMPIDLGTKPVHRLAWFSNDEVIYRVGPPFGEHKGREMVTVYRQKIRAPVKERVQVYQDQMKPGFHMYWSPDWRYAFISPGWPRRGCKLFHASTGKSRSVGPASGDLREFDWRPDSSAFACVFSIARKDQDGWHDRGQHVLLIEPMCGDTTRRIQRVLPGVKGDPEVEWTAEGRYLLLNYQQSHRWLIQPWPWKITSIRKKLMQRLKAAEPGATMVPYLSSFSVPGWLYMKTGPLDPVHSLFKPHTVYLMDYDGQTLVPLTTIWDTDRGRLSPGGEYVADVVTLFGCIRIRRLRPPSPRGGPATAPSQKGPKEKARRPNQVTRP